MEKMIEGLRKLPPERFDFSKIVKHGTPCGTIGCAMGWAPAFFPKEIEWSGNNCANISEPAGLIMDGDLVQYHEAAARLFGLSEAMAMQLFSPVENDDGEDEDYLEHSLHPYLPVCLENATPGEVAKLLKEFLELVDDGKIKTLHDEES